MTELKRLDFKDGKKVDHRRTGRRTCPDAVAGAVLMAAQRSGTVKVAVL
jgi:hypothetical protein